MNATMGNGWGVWGETQPEHEPKGAQFLGTGDGHPLDVSRAMAEAFAEAANRVNGHYYRYEARELPAKGQP